MLIWGLIPLNDSPLSTLNYNTLDTYYNKKYKYFIKVSGTHCSVGGKILLFFTAAVNCDRLIIIIYFTVQTINSLNNKLQWRN